MLTLCAEKQEVRSSVCVWGVECVCGRLEIAKPCDYPAWCTTSETERPLLKDERVPRTCSVSFLQVRCVTAHKNDCLKTSWPWHSFYFPFSLNLNLVWTETCVERGQISTSTLRARPSPGNVHNLSAYGGSADRWWHYRGQSHHGAGVSPETEWEKTWDLSSIFT